MAMNNVYYRFVHIAANKEYGKLPARLRMNVIGKPGVEKVDFELWSLAVSAINGCGMCIDAHEHELRKGGLPTEAIQAAVRIASVVPAVATVLDAEEVLSARSEENTSELESLMRISYAVFCLKEKKHRKHKLRTFTTYADVIQK